MTDKKFTDEEIIRNYEWCIGCTSDRCRECTMDEEGFCEEELQDLVLDLIKRQKTEIERLKSMNQAKLDCIHNLQKENEILSRNADTAFQDGLNERRDLFAPEIKAEAYKEFAQKAAIELTNAYSSEYAHWIDDTLNNLLEKLIGDNK